MITTTITWTPVEAGLPDPETNVLLALSDGFSCEGFLDYDPNDGPIFRDVCAEQLDHGVVVAWADMPRCEVAPC